MAFAADIAAAYATESAAIDLGRGVHDNALHREAVIRCRWRCSIATV